MSNNQQTSYFRIKNPNDVFFFRDAVHVANDIETLFNIVNQSIKIPTLVASVANVNIASAPASIDGVTLSASTTGGNGGTGGDRILLKNQTTASENGIYNFNGAGIPLSRSGDMDESSEVTSGLLIEVNGGTVNAGKVFELATLNPIIIGTTSLTFVTATSTASITSLNGLTAASQTFVNDTNVTVVSAGSTHTITWAGTLAVARGGTGLSTLGTALQQLRVNAGGTALEYFTDISATGWVNGGNAFGGTPTIGNTDNVPLSIKTNNLNRLTILSGGSVGVGNAANNGASTGVAFTARSTGGHAIAGSFTADGAFSGSVDQVAIRVQNTRVTDTSGVFKHIGINITAVNGSDLENDGIRMNVVGTNTPTNYGTYTTLTGDSTSGQINGGGFCIVTSNNTAGINYGYSANVLQLGTASATNYGFYSDVAGGLLNIAFGSVGGSWLSTGTSGVTPVSGAGTRMMWIPGKASFRAGVVTADQWDDSNIGASSFASGIDVQAEASGSFAQGYTVPGGVIRASGLGSFAQGSSDTSGSILAAANGSLARGYSISGAISASGSGSNSLGFTDNGGTITASASAVGAIAFGTADNGAILADEVGSFAGGYSTATGTISADAAGSIAFGSVNEGIMSTSGFGGSVVMGSVGGASTTMSATASGAFALGCIDGSGGNITASANGAFAMGSTEDTGGTILASGKGAFAQGYLDTQALITSSGRGSFAQGYTTGSGSTISATDNGSFAMGASIDGLITSSGVGSLAGGYVQTAEANIISGDGGIVWGSNVSVTANNAFAFGTGFTNSTASSFSVGFGAEDLIITATAVTVGSATTDRFNFLAGDGASAPSTTASPVFTSYYGANTKALGDPVEWIDVQVGGTARKIPTY